MARLRFCSLALDTTSEFPHRAGRGAIYCYCPNQQVCYSEVLRAPRPPSPVGLDVNSIGDVCSLENRVARTTLLQWTYTFGTIVIDLRHFAIGTMQSAISSYDAGCGVRRAEEHALNHCFRNMHALAFSPDSVRNIAQFRWRTGRPAVQMRRLHDFVR